MPDTNPYGNGRLPTGGSSPVGLGLLQGALSGIRNGAGSTTIADGDIGAGIKAGLDNYINNHTTAPTPQGNPMDGIYQQILDAMGQGGGGGGGGGGVSYAPNFSGINEFGAAYDQQIKALDDAMNAAKVRNAGEMNNLTGLYGALAKTTDNQRLALGGQYDQSIAGIGKSAATSSDYVKNLIGSYLAQNQQYGGALGVDTSGVNGKLQNTVANTVGNIQQGAANYQGLLGANKANDNSLFQQYGAAANGAGAAAKSNLAYALEKFLQQGSMSEAKAKGDKALGMANMRNQAISAAGAASRASSGGGGGSNNNLSTLLAIAKMKQGDISQADLNAYRQAQLGQQGNSQSTKMADFYAKLKGLKMNDQAINNAMQMFYGS